jgi:hypothetical protein
MTNPCHALVRPTRVNSGAVFDVALPMDGTARQTARDHYRAGGIVRIHARRPAELDLAKAEIRQ